MRAAGARPPRRWPGGAMRAPSWINEVEPRVTAAIRSGGRESRSPTRWWRSRTRPVIGTSPPRCRQKSFQGSHARLDAQALDRTYRERGAPEPSRRSRSGRAPRAPRRGRRQVRPQSPPGSRHSAPRDGAGQPPATIQPAAIRAAQSHLHRNRDGTTRQPHATSRRWPCSPARLDRAEQLILDADPLSVPDARGPLDSPAIATD